MSYKKKDNKKNLFSRNSPYSDLYDESPVRTALPVSTLPQPPDIHLPGHAGGTVHDPTCSTDLRKVLDLYRIKK